MKSGCMMRIWPIVEFREADPPFAECKKCLMSLYLMNCSDPVCEHEVGDALTKKSSLWEAYHQDMIEQKTRSRKRKTPRWISRLRGFNFGSAPKNVENVTLRLVYAQTRFRYQLVSHTGGNRDDDAVDGNVESVEFPNGKIRK